MDQQRHFDRQLGSIDRALADMAALVERALVIAVDGLRQPYREIGDAAREVEGHVDRLDDALGHDCQALMALRSPVAGDLRRLVSGMRAALVLEMIGDQAESVSRRVRYLARHTPVPVPAAVVALADAALAAYRRALPALATGSGEDAKAVFALEAETDRLSKVGYAAVRAALSDDGTQAAEWSHLLRAIGRLEHIGDLAAELAEEGVFLCTGQSIRHRHEALA
jgi:phosphate transport system protein